MKNRTISLALIFIGIIFYLSACQSKVEVDETFSDYTPPPAFFNDEELAILNEKLDLPNGIEHTYGVSIPITGGNFVFNTDKVIATIGRVLFYDKGLSIDQSTSCSTCHLQEAAFGENIPVSLGLNNEHGKRNSIALGSFISMRRQYYSSTKWEWIFQL